MSKIRTASQIRQEFIDFFVEVHGHTVVPSSPVVPHDDPTLLFANAGMNQFKDVFLGGGSRDYTRAVNSQKCIRAGGKHNDLEDVGKDSYHHTFFEMLGNWSFGDYFKEEAIRWSWDLLTGFWGLEKDRLYATVFGGDEADGLPADEEAEELWSRVTDIDASHVSRWGKKDNFWEMGEVGPCGPCTEIHYDFTDDKSGVALVNADDERVIEIWNNVFIQFNRSEGGMLTPLPAQHVDTGMGFERIVRVLQGKRSNYDIDLWIPIFMAIERLSGARSYGGRLDDAVDVAYRVIADHMRCLTFAITDGALPGHEGRGYVLRRILRRAVRHARQTLGVPGPFLYGLVESVGEAMGDAFPEIVESREKVSEIVREEEESFVRTLDRGLALFDEAAKRANRADSTEISSEDAFKLHDTYGFPVDLTEVMAEERGMTVDIGGYERLMGEARERARGSGVGGALGKGSARSELELSGDEVARLKHMGVRGTDDSAKFESVPIRGRVKAIWKGKDFDEHTGSAETSELIGLILNRTNFYAEMGGQVSDRGRMSDADSGAVFEVEDVYAFGGFVVHVGRCVKGAISVGDSMELTVDMQRRRPVMMNHTGTHLLNLALREVLGDHVDQKGSLVAPDRLRFDFSHGRSMTAEEAGRVTERVEGLIGSDLEVFAQEVAIERARRIRGLRAVFGERYPDPVRVVSIGRRVGELLADPERAEWMNNSIEFCGGTHVARTGEIEGFTLTTEEAVAKGVRRVIALTGTAAIEARAAGVELLKRLEEAGGFSDEDLEAALPGLMEEVDDTVLPYAARFAFRARCEELQARVKAMKKAQAKADRAGAVDQARAIAECVGDGGSVGAAALIVAEISGAGAEALRSAMDVIRDRHPESAVLLLSGDDDANKVAIIAWVPEGMIAQGLKAGDWVREVAKVCGGGGGGRADMAQAGGKDVTKIGEAMERGRGFAGEVLGVEVTRK